MADAFDTSSAFDPDDPFDAAADHVRRRLAGAIIAALEEPEIADLAPGDEIAALICGGLTALVGCVMALVVKPTDHDTLLKAMEAYLPQARLNAEDIINAEDEARH
jgi:hypothetical protein